MLVLALCLVYVVFEAIAHGTISSVFSDGLLKKKHPFNGLFSIAARVSPQQKSRNRKVVTILDFKNTDYAVIFTPADIKCSISRHVAMSRICCRLSTC